MGIIPREKEKQVVMNSGRGYVSYHINTPLASKEFLRRKELAGASPGEQDRKNITYIESLLIDIKGKDAMGRERPVTIIDPAGGEAKPFQRNRPGWQKLIPARTKLQIADLIDRIEQESEAELVDMLITFFQEDIPALEADYEKTIHDARRETDDPEFAMQNHPYSKYKGKYSGEFASWLSFLNRCLLLKQAGYPFDKNDLSFFEWTCLGILENLKLEQAQKQISIKTER